VTWRAVLLTSLLTSLLPSLLMMLLLEILQISSTSHRCWLCYATRHKQICLRYRAHRRTRSTLTIEATRSTATTTAATAGPGWYKHCFYQHFCRGIGESLWFEGDLPLSKKSHTTVEASRCNKRGRCDGQCSVRRPAAIVASGGDLTNAVCHTL
jgi:hypothetical protein